MIETSRREFFKGLLGTGLVLAAPAIIRIPNLLMPIKAEVAQRDWIASYSIARDEMVYVHRWMDGQEYRAVETLRKPAGRGERIVAWYPGVRIPPPAQPADPRGYFYDTMRAARVDNYTLSA